MKKIFSPRDAVPAPDQRVFPLLIQHKGQQATVLEIPNRARLSYTVIYYADGERQRFTRRDFETAFQEAQSMVANLGSYGGDFLPLTGRERRAYERALELLQPLGLSLEDAAAEVVELRKRLNGSASPLEAADYYVRTRPKVSPSITVQAVVDEFIQSRRQEQVGPLYLRDVRNRLGAFAKAFQCPISVATPLAIDAYLNNIQVGLRTRYNYRATIGTLMNFARERGYLPLDFQGLLRNGKKRKFAREVVVFSPQEMASLLAGAKAALVPPLAITAFSGVRAAEVKRLDWKHVKLAKGYIEIPSALSKTGIRRLTPIPDNLRAWLTPHAQPSGPVCAYKNLSNQYEKLASKVRVEWKRNALRHSFVSYRVADINNIPQVAMESGHTVRELQTDYLEVVDKDAATQWFSILPSGPQTVVPRPSGGEQKKDSPKPADAVTST